VTARLEAEAEAEAEAKVAEAEAEKVDARVRRMAAVVVADPAARLNTAENRLQTELQSCPCPSERPRRRHTHQQ
jgi:regulator of protease activity HflC (stomatin/prohibitin superfamily)